MQVCNLKHVVGVFLLDDMVDLLELVEDVYIWITAMFK